MCNKAIKNSAALQTDRIFFSHHSIFERPHYGCTQKHTTDCVDLRSLYYVPTLLQYRLCRSMQSVVHIYASVHENPWNLNEVATLVVPTLVIIPINRLNSHLVVGGNKFLNASTFLGRGWIPLSTEALQKEIMLHSWTNDVYYLWRFSEIFGMRYKVGGKLVLLKWPLVEHQPKLSDHYYEEVSWSWGILQWKVALEVDLWSCSSGENFWEKRGLIIDMLELMAMSYPLLLFISMVTWKLQFVWKLYCNGSFSPLLWPLRRFTLEE
jgi:hypothetical protein